MTFQTDQGYSWVVLAAAFMLNVLYNSGGPVSVGIFLVEFTQHFQVSKSAITILAGFHASVGFIMGFPIGWLCHVFGFRPVAIAAAILTPISFLASAFAPNITTLYVTLGFVASVGQSTLYNIGHMAVQRYFDKKRGFASGLINCGISIGVFIWPPLVRRTIDYYGWRGAFIIIAGVYLHSLVFALLFRPIPKGVQQPDVSQETELSVHTNDEDRAEEARTKCLTGKSKVEQKEGQRCGGALSKISSYLRLLVDYPLLIFHLAGIFAIQGGHFLPYSMIPLRAKALNIDKTRAATLMSIIGIVSLCARVGLGYVGDLKYVNRGLFLGLSGMLAGAITALSSLFTTYILMAIYSALWAIMSAPYVSLLVASIVDIVGVEYTEAGIGYLSLTMGTAGIIALSLSGLILDRLTDPKYAFIFFGSVEVIGGLIVVSAASINIWWKRQTESPNKIND